MEQAGTTPKKNDDAQPESKVPQSDVYVKILQELLPFLLPLVKALGPGAEDLARGGEPVARLLQSQDDYWR
jgi:hypothetical protein